MSVLVMRDATEQFEGTEVAVARLAGTGRPVHPAMDCAIAAGAGCTRRYGNGLELLL